MSNLALTLPDDPALLKALIAALQAENAKISATLRAHDQLIQTLRLRIAKLKKQVFGQSSEKIRATRSNRLELARGGSADRLRPKARLRFRTARRKLPALNLTRRLPIVRRAAVPGSRPARRASGGSWTPALAAPIAVVICALWAKMSARCLI